MTKERRGTPGKKKSLAVVLVEGGVEVRVKVWRKKVMCSLKGAK